MHKYRTHNCNDLTDKNVNQIVKLSGWVHRKRDHGNLLFVDIRDHFGITQCVTEKKNKFFSVVEKVKPESVISVVGKVVQRDKSTQNESLRTGKIELEINEFIILSESNDLPLPVFGEQDYPEEIRLKYRFLDLRRDEMHANIIKRSKIINYLREQMIKKGFTEFQTPILTASSPEGARDFLVPSRVHPGKFYALPQAPQQFKQMIMISGFDKYFQIAPCFRDEDGRADRSPGEHYQLDLEMSFVEQEDIFKTIEPLFIDLFKKFSNKKVNNKFSRIKYKDALNLYGTDKPDLRNPLKIYDISEFFKSEEISLEIFNKNVKSGGVVKAIPVKNTKNKPRSFFDNLNIWSKNEGAKGLAYINFLKEEKKIEKKGPIAKFFSDKAFQQILKKCMVSDEDAVFFISDKEEPATNFAGVARQKIANELNLIDEKEYQFCWIIDFPMYQLDKDGKKLIFSHNPFSMPQVDFKNFDKEDPLKILAYQYDLVCNGFELSSGAIRNHLPEYLFKVFQKVGYSKKDIETRFSGMIKALSYGAPPHGGMAPGVDRIVMLLTDQKNIREITLFPMNQNAEDLLMGAPSEIDQEQLKSVSIKIDKKKN